MKHKKTDDAPSKRKGNDNSFLFGTLGVALIGVAAIMVWNRPCPNNRRPDADAADVTTPPEPHSSGGAAAGAAASQTAADQTVQLDQTTTSSPTSRTLSTRTSSPPGADMTMEGEVGGDLDPLQKVVDIEKARRNLNGENIITIPRQALYARLHSSRGTASTLVHNRNGNKRKVSFRGQHRRPMYTAWPTFMGGGAA